MHTVIPTGFLWPTLADSGRNSLPSATATLQSKMQDRDIHEGWLAKCSNVFARVTTRRITCAQKAVSATLQSNSDSNTFAEDERIQDFSAFMERLGFEESECSRSINHCILRACEEMPSVSVVGDDVEATRS